MSTETLAALDRAIDDANDVADDSSGAYAAKRRRDAALLQALRDGLASPPSAFGFGNTAITGKPHALMMVRLDIPSEDQYGGALWTPLYALDLK